ncbi:MAG: hypothetical protein JWL69_2506 [Phycisphaerales bacterium]|nr:hypothetical protein [Phycisphaerales bacterium]
MLKQTLGQPRSRTARLVSAILAVATAISAAACAGGIYLWVRSYWTQDVWGWSRGDYRRAGAIGVATSRGKILICWYPGARFAYHPDDDFGHGNTFPETFTAANAPDYWGLPMYEDASHTFRWTRTSRDFLGFGLKSEGKYATTTFATITLIPCWFVVSVTGLGAPGIWTMRCWKRRRDDRKRASGLCHRCGYDLRASAERCPECGAMKKSAPRNPA